MTDTPPGPDYWPKTQPEHAIVKTVLGVPVGFAMVKGRKEYYIFRSCASHVIRYLGSQGWDIYKVRRLLAGLMIPLADSTIRSYRSVGSRNQGHIAFLPPERLAQLEKIVEVNPEVDPWGLPNSRVITKQQSKYKKKVRFRRGA